MDKIRKGDIFSYLVSLSFQKSFPGMISRRMHMQEMFSLLSGTYPVYGLILIIGSLCPLFLAYQPGRPCPSLISL
jgi:hypothetical protein